MSNDTGYITDGTFDKIDVSKISVNSDAGDPSTGIIDAEKLNISQEIDSDTIYCKKLIVTESLFIPVENMPNIKKNTVLIDRVQGPKTIDINTNMGKLSYDGTLKDLKTTSNTGEKRSVTDTHMSITNNTRFKENIMLYGWSPGDKSDTALHQSNYKDIDLDEHVYYQGCGYIIGFNNPSATQTNDVVTTVEVPPSTQTTIIPETTQVNVVPEHTVTTTVPESTQLVSSSFDKYYNTSDNPNLNIDNGKLAELPSSGSGDCIGFDSHNNCYKLQFSEKKIHVIKTTGENVLLHTSQYNIFSFVIDTDDIMWVNTTSGANKLLKIVLNNGSITSNTEHGDYSNTIPTDFRNIALNSKDELYVITGSGGYIYKLSKIDSTYSQYFGPVNDNDPRALCFDNYDNIIYGGRLNKKLWIVSDNNGTPSQTNYGGITSEIGTIFGISVDINNDIYVSVQSLNLIKKVTSEGSINTFIGNGNNDGSLSPSGDPLLSSIKTPGGSSFDNYGDFYVTQNVYPNNITDHVRYVGFEFKKWEDSPKNNTITPVNKTYITDPYLSIPLNESKLINNISETVGGIVRDSTGRIIIGTWSNRTHIISSDGSNVTSATHSNILSGAAIDKNDNVYFSTWNGDKILIMNPQGNMSDLLTSANGIETHSAICNDNSKELIYFAGHSSHKIRRFHIDSPTDIEEVVNLNEYVGIFQQEIVGAINVNSMHITQNNILIIAVSGGILLKIHLSNGNKMEYLSGTSSGGYNISRPHNFNIGSIWGITSDSSNNIYLGSYNFKVIIKMTLDGEASLLVGTVNSSSVTLGVPISQTSIGQNTRDLLMDNESGILFYGDQSGNIVALSIKPDVDNYINNSKIYDNTHLDLYDLELNNYINNHSAYDITVDNQDVKYFTCQNENKIYKVASDKTMEVFYTESDATFIMEYLCADSNRNIYVTGKDKGIKKIEPNGNPTQYLAQGSHGEIRGITINSADVLHFIADDKGIYKIENGTVIQLVSINDAGVVCGYDTYGIAFDSLGNLFVSENDAGQIFKINTQNSITVYAGINSSYGHQDGTALSATFTSMRGIKVDIMGNVYVSSKDKHIIRKISNNGVVTTICGTADTPGNINGQNGTLNEPNGLLIDQHGDLYITELTGHIRVLGLDLTISYPSMLDYTDNPNITTPLNEIKTLHPSAIQAHLSRGFVSDSSGNLFVTVLSPPSVKKIEPNGTVTTFWTGSYTHANYIAIDKNENLFVSLRGGSQPYKIIKINTSGVESDYWVPSVGGDAPGPLCVNSKGVLICALSNYLSSVKNTKLIEINSNGETYLLRDISNDLGGTIVNHYNISSMTIDTEDNIYMTELLRDTLSSYNAGRILKYNKDSGISVLAGDGVIGYNSYEDGIGLKAKLNHPMGITVDKFNNIYFTEHYKHRVRKITSLGSVTTVAGIQYSGNIDGPIWGGSLPSSTSARLNNPIDILIDNYGILNVLDKNSGNIRGINIDLQDTKVTKSLSESAFSLRASTGTTLYQQLTTIPTFTSFEKWKIDMTFNYNGNNGSWNGIIGSMYNNEVVSNRGWGLWRTAAGYLHWSGSTQTVNLTTLTLDTGVNYKLILEKLQGTGNIDFMKFTLINLDNGIIKVETSDYFVMDQKRVDIGGLWQTSTSETFSGVISEVNLYIGDEFAYGAISEKNTISQTLTEIVPAYDIETVVPESTETITVPASTVTVVVPGYTSSVTTTTEVFRPIAFMSRLDYFVVTIDSFTNTTSFPVNFLDISLYNSIDTDLRMNVVRKDTKFKLELTVNSTEEVKWFGIINLKKIYLKRALDRLTDDNLKFNSSDNLINWQPVISTRTHSDLCFKFVEDVKFLNISPFSSKVITDQVTFNDSVIDDSLFVEPKIVKKRIPSDPTSIREIVDDTIYLDTKSSAFNYNTTGYHSTFLIQPSCNDIKKLTTSYAHTSYFLNNKNNSETVTFENEFGNSFTKVSTKDASNFSTSEIVEDTNDIYYDDQLVNTISNKKINFIFQLKEKEQKYQPVLAILYYRMFSAKAYNDPSDSIAHREYSFEKKNVFDIADNLEINLQLYKNISDFTENVPKQIFMTQKTGGIDELRYFNLGTHHFIKSYVNIRDITNNKNVFFTHYSSIILPTYSVMRQFFTQKKEEGVTDLAVMKTKFIEKYINSNTIINDLDTNSYEEGNSSEYQMQSPSNYINSNGKKYIDEDTSDIDLIKFNLSVETEPIFEQNIVDNIITNSIEVYHTIETAYKTFDIKFPVKVMCTSEYNSKFQVNVLLEINKFNLDTY